MKNSLYDVLVSIISNAKIEKSTKSKFIKNNINELTLKDFQIKNVSNNTILHYLCRYLFKDTLIILFKQFDLKINHFQNIDSYSRSELYWLCRNKMNGILMLLMTSEEEGYQLNAKYFQNADRYLKTELYYLCKNKMHDILVNLHEVKVEHLQNIDQYGETELRMLCINNMSDTMNNLNSNFMDGHKFKAKHFLNKNGESVRELDILCINEMKETIDLVKDWKAEHFGSIERQLYADKIKLFPKKIESITFKSFTDFMKYVCKHDKLTNTIKVTFA